MSMHCALQVAACQGQEGDATPFTDVKVDDVSEQLHTRGYQRYGWEVSAAGPLQASLDCAGMFAMGALCDRQMSGGRVAAQRLELCCDGDQL